LAARFAKLLKAIARPDPAPNHKSERSSQWRYWRQMGAVYDSSKILVAIGGSFADTFCKNFKPTAPTTDGSLKSAERIQTVSC
jgi:hypothetical protein